MLDSGLDWLTCAEVALAIAGVKPDQVCRCRTNSAHARQSWPDSGLGLQVSILQNFQVVPVSLGSGRLKHAWFDQRTFCILLKKLLGTVPRLILWENIFNLKRSGNEVYCTNA